MRDNKKRRLKGLRFLFCRDDRIRTCDHMTPSHVRYRAAENLYLCYFDVAVAYIERLWTTRKNVVDYGMDILFTTLYLNKHNLLNQENLI